MQGQLSTYKMVKIFSSLNLDSDHSQQLFLIQSTRIIVLVIIFHVKLNHLLMRVLYLLVYY